MSIVGILASNLLNLTSPNPISPQPSFQKEFQQLGKDLQSGNLSAAQQDFSKIPQSQGIPAHHLHHYHSGGGAGAGEQTNLPQEFAQLGQDLQAGNVSAAQKAYSTVQQSFATFGANSAFTSAPAVSSVA